MFKRHGYQRFKTAACRQRYIEDEDIDPNLKDSEIAKSITR